MTKEISNSDDVIDSRDIIKRIEELEAKETAINDAQEALTAIETETTSEEDIEAARELLSDAEDDFDEDEREELKQLRSLAEDGDGYASDWKYGCQLIRESYFEQYARETADDLYGKELRDSHWPFSCIDWEQAAEELLQDYTAIEFGDVTYYVR